ncbi:1-aminocyclopropane-1-carboxylate oxidase homolog 1-like [Macadamia integrifolia]|uniref:1-aminocyclopropane-1-carboxylate oxidase homolog 1-like n=1 Tax=Macadamia integrifolia TaxID=60698 RepID=UPI001C4E8018|nr:1-aminocyclopropane-1-carboxylate oxidase homolog 1-like [Macadamia integrifolia]XP_042505347.1 1-aminocyclopropane-1-carboxylate oxidase homolog 1-like [Macadamia integrifolia]XP_042505348.1 1-aminocyclopropane-1-carboxylate oxidase homolog 1-like [Macadamia integrifolia]
MTLGAANSDQDYDRTAAVKQFDDSKIGVKGLVDSGAATIPPFFIHPPETLPNSTPSTAPPASDLIPVVDLSGLDSNHRSRIVKQIRDASREFGFFQVINHGIPSGVINHTIDAIKAFNEQPTEVKSQYYTRDLLRGVSFATNFDLFQSKAASWRDTIHVNFSPMPPEIDHIPEIFRREVLEWDQHTRRLGEVLMEILSEGLGVKQERLKELSCLEGRVMAAHYYPYCPQPDLTLGVTSHTDPGVLTVLLQNHIRGLQVKHEDEWLDVKPVPDALIINIGDILQMLSNNEYKSVEHRVLAHPRREPRISIAVFLNPGKTENLYGPMPELTSPEKSALYRQFTLVEYMERFMIKELDGKSMINFFRL